MVAANQSTRIATYSNTATTGSPKERRRSSPSINDKKVIDPPTQKSTNATDVSFESAQLITNSATNARDIHARKVGPFFTPIFYHPRMKNPLHHNCTLHNNLFTKHNKPHNDVAAPVKRNHLSVNYLRSA
jgi:hypothetical protein